MRNHSIMFLITICILCMLFGVSCKKEITQAPSTGTMNITSTPSGASITILNKDIGVTPRKTNPIPPGMYIVKVTKEGFKPSWTPVKVEIGKETSLNINLEQLTSTVVLDTIPTGAAITMNNKAFGDAPVILDNLPLGTYKAMVKLQGYAQKEVTWEIPNERPVMIKVPLTNNVGTLSLTCDPEVAAVTIDGKNYGNTPLKETLEQGQYKIMLTKEGYKNYEKVVTVLREKVTEESVTLETLPGSLVVESHPTGATVLIDGIEYGVTPYTRASIEVGEYEVTLKKNGYDDFVENVSIQPGARIVKEFEMMPNTGSIVLAVNPAGMNVYLDGKFIAKTVAESSDDVCKPITINDLPFGKHTVTVSNKNAEPQKRELVVTVQKGKTVTVPKVDFWLPNTELILKNGSIYKGRISGRYTEDSEKLLFRHSIGINSEYKRSEIRSVTPLKISD